MHILHIYKDYAPIVGGIENHVKALAEGLAARGHRVTVLVTNTASHDTMEQNGALRIIKAARLIHTASTPLSSAMFRHARRLTDVDVVNLHFPYPPGDLAALLVPRRPPLVVTYHSDIIRQQRILQGYAPLLRHTLARAARILPTSANYIASSPWLRPHAARCTVSPLSVDLSRFDPPDPPTIAAIRARYEHPILLFVGRLRYYKGLHFLLQALPHMRRPAQVLLVGTGPEEARLRAMAHTLDVATRIHFLGDVSDEELPALYAAATVFVLPSHLRSEAFGIVQLEAQAASLPTVCTELGTGTSAITRHGRTGFVVPPADPLALARALDVLLANPEMARRMGAAGRVQVEQEGSHPRMVERVERVYTEVCRAAR